VEECEVEEGCEAEGVCRGVWMCLIQSRIDEEERLSVASAVARG